VLNPCEHGVWLAGKLTLANEEVYEGEWKDDKRNGQGEQGEGDHWVGGGSVETRRHTHINTIMPTHQRGTQPNTTACTHVLLVLIFSERERCHGHVCVWRGCTYTYARMYIYEMGKFVGVHANRQQAPLHPFMCARASAHARVS